MRQNNSISITQTEISTECLMQLYRQFEQTYIRNFPVTSFSFQIIMFHKLSVLPSAGIHMASALFFFACHIKLMPIIRPGTHRSHRVALLKLLGDKLNCFQNNVPCYLNKMMEKINICVTDNTH
jgi:hypothetical protein